MLQLVYQANNAEGLSLGVFIVIALIVIGFWLLWFFTTLGIRQEQNEFRDEMKWRLDVIIEALKKKDS